MYAKTTQLLLDYYHAVRTTRRSVGGIGLSAAADILAARLRHDIGPQFYSLFSLSSVPRERWNSYLLDRDFKGRIRSLNGPDRRLVSDKVAFYEHCVKNGIPTIPILSTIYVSQDADGASISSRHPSREWLTAMENAPSRIFAKLIDGSHGKSAFPAERVDKLWKYDGQMGSSEELFRFCLSRDSSGAGWMFQPCISPHNSLRAIMAPGALGTIRAVTYQTRSGSRVTHPVLRIPVGNNAADNFAHGRSGNLVAAIDMETGALGSGIVSLDRVWPLIAPIDTHPDTKNRITGLKLPYWKETKELLEAAQTQTHTFKSLGWDIALTDDGPLVVEANSTYDIDILQVAYRKGLKAELMELLRACEESGIQDRVPEQS